VEIKPRTIETFRQDRRGRPGPETRYVRSEATRFDLSWRIDHDRLAESLLERELRGAMAREGVESLPLYPEGRACRHPTAHRVIDQFEDVQRHELVTEGRAAVVFLTDLVGLQRQILRLLRMPKAYSG
jgi:hypothetical protein